jgi:hypothetical protein
MTRDHTHSWIQWKIQVGRKKFPKKIGGEIAYRCSAPSCTTYKPKSLVLGTYSECPKCGSIFVLDSRNINMVTPTCETCRNTIKGRQLREAKDMLKSVFDLQNIVDEIRKDENAQS